MSGNRDRRHAAGVHRPAGAHAARSVARRGAAGQPVARRGYAPMRRSVSLETDGGATTLDSSGARPLRRTSVVADADGFLAIEPASTAGGRGTRRLIGLVVTPDRPPQLKVDDARPRPAAAEHAPRARSRVTDATDDLALADAVRAVHEGRPAPARTSRSRPARCPRRSRARPTPRGRDAASLALAALKLEPGDMVIYRGVAADRRPGRRHRPSPTRSSSKSRRPAPSRWRASRSTTAWIATPSASRW